MTFRRPLVAVVLAGAVALGACTSSPEPPAEQANPTTTKRVPVKTLPDNDPYCTAITTMISTRPGISAENPGAYLDDVRRAAGDFDVVADAAPEDQASAWRAVAEAYRNVTAADLPADGSLPPAAAKAIRDVSPKVAERCGITLPA